MRKKILVIAIAATATVSLALGINSTAHAQMFTYTGTTSTGASTATPSLDSSANSSTSTATSTVAPSTTPISVFVAPAPTIASTENESEYLQLNGLVVTEISGSDIFAANPNYPSANGNDTAIQTAAPDVAITCQEFASDSAMTGIDSPCPVPSMETISSTSSLTAAATGTYYVPYTIELNPTTQLLLDDRSSAVLGNITPGDTINVYGYYDGTTGTINAEIVRDLSKPANATTTVATIQAEISQLEALLTQLEASTSATATPSSSVY